MRDVTHLCDYISVINSYTRALNDITSPLLSHLRVRRIGQSAAEVESIWISGFELDKKVKVVLTYMAVFVSSCSILLVVYFMMCLKFVQLDEMLLKKLRSAEKVLSSSEHLERSRGRQQGKDGKGRSKQDEGRAGGTGSDWFSSESSMTSNLLKSLLN